MGASKISIGAAITLVAGLIASPARANDLKSLVRAELAFSKLAETQGIRAAFVANLADEAIVFRPRPVPGLKLYQDRPSVPGYLSWKPARAEVAASGDLGFTTGPYEFRNRTATDPIAGRGHFISVWRVQKDGAWKVVFDGGIDYEGPFTAEPALDPDRMPAGETATRPAGAGDAVRAEAGIRDAERALAAAAAKDGAAALAEAMSDDVRFNRSGAHPYKGLAAARGALAAMRGVLTWDLQGVHASAAGDLGYVYGVSEIRPGAGAGTESASFLRIWRKRAGGRWEIVLALFSKVG